MIKFNSKIKSNPKDNRVNTFLIKKSSQNSSFTSIWLLRYIVTPLTLFLLLFFNLSLAAQDNTLYYLNAVPQSLELNPALQYRCRIFIELPVISSVSLGLNSTGAGYHDAIHYGTGSKADSLYYDFNHLEKTLHKVNALKTDLDITLLGFGFAFREEWYFTFRIYNHTEVRIEVPHDVIALKDGNWNITTNVPQNIDLSGIGANAMNYTVISVGASRKVDESLQWGVRLKYLMGAANANTAKSDIQLLTNDNPISLRAITKIKLNASFPVDIGYDNNGFVNNADFSRAGTNILGNYIFNRNRGVGIDLGVVYNYDENLSFYASVLDLGFIRWKSNVQRFNANGSIDFNGIDLNRLQGGQQTQLLKALKDSISNAFRFAIIQKPYFTFNTTRIFGGATYLLTKKLNAGILAKTEIYDLRIHPSLTASLNYTPFRFLALSLSTSYMNNQLSGPGFALALGGSGLQFYIVTDNIPFRYVQDKTSAMLWPYSARSLNLRFGFNLIFGCKQKKNIRHLKAKAICPAYNN